MRCPVPPSTGHPLPTVLPRKAYPGATLGFLTPLKISMGSDCGPFSNSQGYSAVMTISSRSILGLLVPLRVVIFHDDSVGQHLLSVTGLSFFSILKISMQKRACNTATCMTHRLAGWLSRSGSMVRSNLLPTKMGFKIFSGPRRNYWF